MTIDVWGPFRRRLMEGNQQARYLTEWSKIRALTDLPENEALEQLRTTVSPERMDEAAFLFFRNAVILVQAAYMHDAGLAGVTDPVEWQNGFSAYLARPGPEIARYKRFLTLREKLEVIRKPENQQPPYSSEELSLGEACNELFAPLAIAMNQAAPGLATKEVAEELQAMIGEYTKRLADTKPENRARRQAQDAIAEAKYAIRRTYLIQKDYRDANDWFQASLEAFEALGDSIGAQTSRQQLASLRVVESGDVDAAVQANLEVLTSKKGSTASLERAKALVDQLNQTLHVGDTYEATKLLPEAIKELNRQLYLDPGSEDLETCFAQWVDSVPLRLQGIDFCQELAHVVTLYSAIFGARATLPTPTPATEKQRTPEEQLSAFVALSNKIMLESFNADDDLQQRFMEASARPLGFYGAATA